MPNIVLPQGNIRNYLKVLNMRFFLFLVTLFHFLLNHKILVYTILKSVEVSDPNETNKC